MFNLIAAPIFAVNLFLNINVEYAISSTPVSQMDPETSTIVVINSLHYRTKPSSKFHYNEKKLSINPIKNRK